MSPFTGSARQLGDFNRAANRRDTLHRRAPGHPGPTRLEVLDRLGFTWKRVGGSQRVHLVGRIVHEGSHAECGMPVTPDDVLEAPSGLLDELPRCKRCEKP